MKFNNIDEIVKFYGMSSAIEIFEEFSRRINEMLRETDIVCKDDDFKIWIFLPATSKKGIENRLKTIIDNMQPQNGPGIKINIQIIYSSSIETTDTAESLMSKLEFTND
jgi:GGDEF domain-containing protein